jgi:hypothetical protein
VGAYGVHGEYADGVFAAVEYDYGDSTAGDSGEYGGDGFVVCGGFGWVVYCNWK